MFVKHYYMELFIFLIICTSVYVADPIDAKTREILRVGQQNLMAVQPQPQQQPTGQPTNNNSSAAGSEKLAEVKEEPIEHEQNIQSSSEPSVNFVDIARAMERTHQMMQMILIANLGSENFEKARKIVEGVEIENEQESPSQDLEEEQDFFVSNGEECEKMAQYSEYRHSVFTKVKNKQVNTCLANILKNMSVNCAIFFTNLEIGITYYFAVKIFDCYLFQSDSDSCASI